MKMQGWFEADPFWVHLTEDGTLRVLLGDVAVYRERMRVTTYQGAEQSPSDLVVLPGNNRLPPFSNRSWINQRGLGQIVRVGKHCVFCRLNGRMRSAPMLAEASGPQPGQHRHPKAAFWLWLAADAAGADMDLGLLQELTGYSYPTVRTWARNEATLGHLQAGKSGRTQQFTVTRSGRAAWWREIQTWWPTWRSERWPRLHGPGNVSWARWSRRLPEHAIGVRSSAPPPAQPESWIWATGADHVAAMGRLVQTYDSDVWMSQSAWNAWKDDAKPQPAPVNAQSWNGTRVSVMDDDAPLARLLCARAGIAHPAFRQEVQPRFEDSRTLLLEGLPLLDTLTASDARVVAQGQDLLADLFKKALT
jgi:hypothetical protein